MHFTLRITENNFTGQVPTVGSTMAPTILPFPMSGKFRCRIIGYEFITTQDHNVSVCKVVSRALLNPMQPDKVFQFIPDRINNAFTIYHMPARAFSATGWWPIELHNSIDVQVVPDDDPTVITPTLLAPFTFLLHLELEKFPEENAHRMK
jgi:hypothetical protein